jgi:hypothetical protein
VQGFQIRRQIYLQQGQTFPFFRRMSDILTH